MMRSTQLDHAREVVANPERYFGQPGLIADSYALLKEARGETVRHDRLTARHSEYVEVAAVARGRTADILAFTPPQRPRGLLASFWPTGDDAA